MKRNNYLTITIYLLLIVLLVFTVVNSIYVNPGDAIVYQVNDTTDTYLINYTFAEPYNLSQIIIASTSITFNDTKFEFNIGINMDVTINHIDEDVLAPDGSDDILLNFTLYGSDVGMHIDISGLKADNIYSIYRDTGTNSHFGDISTDGSGVLGWDDTRESGMTYTIFDESNLVRTDEETDVTNTSVTLNGYLDFDSGETCWVWFEFGLNNSYGTNTTNQTKDEGESFSNTTGDVLDGGTLYHYRAIANNSFGMAYGEDELIHTQTSPPTNFTATNIGNGDVNISWTHGNDNYSGTFTYLDIDDVLKSDGTEEYYIFNGVAGTTYNARLYSQTPGDSGSFPNSETIYLNFTVNTPPNITNPIPANHSIVDTGTTLSIDVNDSDGDTFNWSIEIDPNVGFSNHSDDTNGTKTATVNLSHNTNYTWYVNITDSYDWANYTYNFTSMVQYVNAPTDGVSVYDTTNNRLNLSWTGNSRANNYTLIQRNDTYASSVNQSGNWVRKNDSFLYWNNSWTETSGGYFTVFSWNWTGNIYSYNTSIPLGLDIPWGALAVNVYNESNGSQGIEFDIEISDTSGHNVYFAFDQTNTLYLDINEIPYGENTIFFITSDGYESRTNYRNLVLNNFYNYNFFLPPYTTPSDPGGGDPGGEENYTTTRLYRLRVIDEYTYPIANATAQIRRYMNATGKYENMSILLTDGYGEADLYLIPGEHYRAHISKTGYDSGIFDWIPDPVFYGANYPKIFQIVGSTEIITTYTFHDLIRFNATLFTNGSLFVNYIDYDTNTTDAQFYVYEQYNFSTTYITTESTTSNTFSFWINDLNFSREHEIIIYLNHTTLGFEVESIIISPVSNATYDGGGGIEKKVENVFGPFRLGYVQVFLVYIPIMLFLVLPGRNHPGFAIIMASVYAGWASSFIIVGSILMIVPFAIAIGAVLMAVKGGLFKL